MNSWQKIREYFTEGTKPGSMGEQMALVKASNLYRKLVDNLTDKILSTDSFNVDEDLRVALFNRQHIEQIMELTGDKNDINME